MHFNLSRKLLKVDALVFRISSHKSYHLGILMGNAKCVEIISRFLTCYTPDPHYQYFQCLYTAKQNKAWSRISITYWHDNFHTFCCDFCLFESIITTRKRSLRRLCFYRCLSVHGGGRACHMTGGHAWWWGGMHARGHVCPGGACMSGGAMRGRGGMRGRGYGRSMSGRYASYWNAFLFFQWFVHTDHFRIFRNVGS